MRITLYELRKIFEWKKVLVTAALCFIFYFWSIDFHLRFFPNGDLELAIYNLSVQMLEEHGVSISEQEFEEFRNKPLDSWKEIEARDWFIEVYENREWHLDDSFWFWAPGEVERNREILNREELSILPGVIMTNYQNMIHATTRMILMSIAIMLSTLYIKERKNRMLSIQYSTKLGRKLFCKKIIAASIGAIIISTIQLAIIFTLYRGNETTMFFESDINSIWGIMTWYDMTFGQYIMLTVGLVYILGILMAIFTLFLSRLSPNYLTVIGGQILIYLFFSGVWPEYIMAIGNPLDTFLIRTPINMRFPEFVIPTVYAGLIIMVTSLMVFQWRKEKKIDITV